MDFQNSFSPVNANIQIGIIQKINDVEGEFLSYNVFIENYHSEKEFTIGIPIFSFGYNSYTYVPGCRVICLIKDGDYSEIIIIGQIYDRNIKRNVLPPAPGQLQLSTSSAQRSGFAEFGFNDKFLIYAGNSNLKFDSNSFNFKINNDVFLTFSNSEFILKLNKDGGGLSIKDNKTLFNNSNGFYSIASNGPIYFQGQKFSFTEGNSENPNLLISKGLHRQIGVEYLNIFSTYKFSGGSKVKGVDDTVEWNMLTGNYAIRLGTGDFKVNLMNTVAAEVYFKIGVGPLYLSQFSLKQSGLEIKIGPPSGGSKLDMGLISTTISAGSLLVSTSKIDIMDTQISLTGQGNPLTKSSLILSSLLGILMTPATGLPVTIDGDVVISGTLTVASSVTSSDITTGNITAADISTTTIKSINAHTHTSSAPGAPTGPPLP